MTEVGSKLLFTCWKCQGVDGLPQKRSQAIEELIKQEASQRVHNAEKRARSLQWAQDRKEKREAKQKAATAAATAALATSSVAASPLEAETTPLTEPETESETGTKATAPAHVTGPDSAPASDALVVAAVEPDAETEAGTKAGAQATAEKESKEKDGEGVSVASTFNTSLSPEYAATVRARAVAAVSAISIAAAAVAHVTAAAAQETATREAATKEVAPASSQPSSSKRSSLSHPDYVSVGREAADEEGNVQEEEEEGDALEGGRVKANQIRETGSKRSSSSNPSYITVEEGWDQEEEEEEQEKEEGDAQEDEEETEERRVQRLADLEVKLFKELPSMTPTEATTTVARVIKLLSQSRTIRHSASCCQVKAMYIAGATMDRICKVLRSSVNEGAVQRVIVVVRRVLGNSLFMCGVTHS